MLRSSTSSSRLRPSPALWVALAVLAVVRIGIEPLREWPKADRQEDLYDYRVVEKFFVQDLEARPRVLLMGSSISMYGFVPERLAAALDLPADAVRNLAIPGSGPWDAVVLLRRNPKLLEEAELLVFDVQPYMLNAHYEHAVPDRFYNLATLGDALRVHGLAKWKAVANWVWPWVAIRRPLRAWILGIGHWRAGSVPFERGAYYPRWHPESQSYQATDAALAATLADPKYQPRRWAEVTLDRFAFSERQAGAFRELVALLRERGARVLFHQAPIHPDYFARAREDETFRRGVERYRAFVATLEGDGVRVVFWKGPEEVGFAPSDLPDYGHMTRSLAERYTDVMAERIRREGLLR